MFACFALLSNHEPRARVVECAGLQEREILAGAGVQGRCGGAALARRRRGVGSIRARAGHRGAPLLQQPLNEKLVLILVDVALLLELDELCEVLHSARRDDRGQQPEGRAQGLLLLGSLQGQTPKRPWRRDRLPPQTKRFIQARRAPREYIVAS